jgi:hypothetical protein
MESSLKQAGSYMLQLHGLKNIEKDTPENLAEQILRISRGYPIGLLNIPKSGENAKLRRAFFHGEAIRLLVTHTNPTEEFLTPEEHLERVKALEFNDLIEALATGANHPALEAWQEKRTAPANRQPPTRRGRRLREIAIDGVEVLHANGMSFQSAYHEVAQLINKTGAFDDYNEKQISAKALQKWRERSGRPVLLDDEMEISKIFKLNRIKKDYKKDRTFLFWREVIRITVLAEGAAWIYQMLLEGYDPAAGFPEKAKAAFLIKS